MNWRNVLSAPWLWMALIAISVVVAKYAQLSQNETLMNAMFVVATSILIGEVLAFVILKVTENPPLQTRAERLLSNPVLRGYAIGSLTSLIDDAADAFGLDLQKASDREVLEAIEKYLGHAEAFQGGKP